MGLALTTEMDTLHLVRYLANGETREYVMHGASFAWMLAQVKALPHRRYEAAGARWRIDGAGLVALQALATRHDVAVDACSAADAAEGIDALLAADYAICPGDDAAYAALVREFEGWQAWRDEHRRPEDDSAEHRAAVRALKARIDALEWSREQTISRRAAWNRLATRGVGYRECQERLGIMVADLKAAVAAHTL